MDDKNNENKEQEEEEEVPACAICTTPLAGTPRTITPCNHEFHRDCLREYEDHVRGGTYNCPFCRGIVPKTIVKRKEEKNKRKKKKTPSPVVPAPSSTVRSVFCPTITRRARRSRDPRGSPGRSGYAKPMLVTEETYGPPSVGLIVLVVLILFLGLLTVFITIAMFSMHHREKQPLHCSEDNACIDGPDGFSPDFDHIESDILVTGCEAECTDCFGQCDGTATLDRCCVCRGDGQSCG